MNHSEREKKKLEKTMMIRKAWTIVFCFVVACAVFLPAAMADERDQMTRFTFTEPVAIPGNILPAGAYWFVLQEDRANRNVVQIYSDDWSTLYATLVTVPSYRQQATSETEVRFAEQPSQKPEALLKWYYPGLATGHEFLYTYTHAMEFTREVKRDVQAEPAMQ
jgi:hypothetical protein